MARRKRQRRQRQQRERHHLAAPPKTARPHVRRYYVTLATRQDHATRVTGLLPRCGARVNILPCCWSPPASSSSRSSPAPWAGAGAVPAPPGRTVTVVATDDVGAPLERAFPSATYAHAVAADAELRWDDARLLYRQAADDWTATARTRPSRALQNAIAKAEHEASVSQALAGYQRLGIASLEHLPLEARRAFVQRQALEVGRNLRAKLMATRAVLGQAPPELYARTRARLEEARDAATPNHAAQPRTTAATPRPSCCSARRTPSVGTPPPRVWPAPTCPAPPAPIPANAVARAACAAALGETEAALAALESFVLRPLFPRSDIALRDVYLANDWDHLRGDPRFESLFR